MQLRLSRFDVGRHAVHVRAGEREEPAEVVRLNLGGPAVLCRDVRQPPSPNSSHARQASAEDDLDARAGRRHPGVHPASAAARSWRGAFRTSQQTAQSRFCVDKPGGPPAPRGENGPFLEQSGSSYARNKGLGELVPPQCQGKSLKNVGAGERDAVQ